MPKKKKPKTTTDLMKEIRGTWTIDPRTRVHDNDDRKNKKKERQENKNLAKEAINEQNT